MEGGKSPKLVCLFPISSSEMPRANNRRKEEKRVQSIRKYKWYNRRKIMVDE
jgi:hypothetical protein